MSGLQLRWAPLPQAAIFATTNLIALAEDFPSRAGQFERLRPTDRRPLYSSLVLRFNARAAWSSHTFGVQSEDTPKTNIFSTHPQFQRTCRLVFAYLRRPDRRWCPQHRAILMKCRRKFSFRFCGMLFFPIFCEGTKAFP